MAWPQHHALATLSLISMSEQVGHTLFQSEKAFFLLVGVFIDLDHFFTKTRLKRLWQALVGLIRGQGWIIEKIPMPGHINFFHDWTGLILLSLVFIILGQYFALAIYIIHLLIDGGNVENLNYKNSPVPLWLVRHYPDRVKYRLDPFI